MQAVLSEAWALLQQPDADPAVRRATFVLVAAAARGSDSVRKELVKQVGVGGGGRVCQRRVVQRRQLQKWGKCGCIMCWLQVRRNFWRGEGSTPLPGLLPANGSIRAGPNQWVGGLRGARAGSRGRPFHFPLAEAPLPACPPPAPPHSVGAAGAALHLCSRRAGGRRGRAAGAVGQRQVAGQAGGPGLGPAAHRVPHHASVGRGHRRGRDQPLQLCWRGQRGCSGGAARAGAGGGRRVPGGCRARAGGVRVSAGRGRGGRMAVLGEWKGRWQCWVGGRAGSRECVLLRAQPRVQTRESAGGCRRSRGFWWACPVSWGILRQHPLLLKDSAGGVQVRPCEQEKGPQRPLPPLSRCLRSPPAGCWLCGPGDGGAGGPGRQAV